MIPRPVLTKIPGELPKQKSDRYVEDFSKLTKAQLLEIKDREEKLLAKKAQISRLPDKGKRIQEFYQKVLREIASRDEIEEAAKLFSDFNIASTGEKKLQGLEWTGKYDPGRGEAVLDSDDEEETDPLKIIAQSTNLEKSVKILKPETPLITEEDLKEIESFNNEPPVVEAEIIHFDVKAKIGSLKPKLEPVLDGSSSSHNSSSNSLNLDPHVLYLFEKGADGIPQKEKFKPYKTTKSNVHDPQKERLRKQNSHWEVTAATPPPIQHSGTKLISLQESVNIQTEYAEKLKKLQEKQAQERLAAKSAKLANLKISLPEESARKLNKFFGGYRDTFESDSDAESEEGVRDDEDERGGVTFTVSN